MSRIVTLLLILATTMVIAQERPELRPGAEETTQSLNGLLTGWPEWSDDYLPQVRTLLSDSSSANRFLAAAVLLVHRGEAQDFQTFRTELARLDDQTVQQISMALTAVMRKLEPTQIEAVLPVVREALADPRRPLLAATLLETWGPSILDSPARSSFLELLAEAARQVDPNLQATALSLYAETTPDSEGLKLLRASTDSDDSQVLLTGLRSLSQVAPNDPAIARAVERLCNRIVESPGEWEMVMISLSFDEQLAPLFRRRLKTLWSDGNPGAAEPLGALITSYEQLSFQEFEELFGALPEIKQLDLLRGVEEGRPSDQMRDFLRDQTNSGIPSVAARSADLLYRLHEEEAFVKEWVRTTLAGGSPAAALLILRAFPEMTASVRSEVLKLTAPENSDEVQNKAFLALLAEERVSPEVYHSVENSLREREYTPVLGLYGPAPQAGITLLTPADIDQALILSALEGAAQEQPSLERNKALVVLLHLLDSRQIDLAGLRLLQSIDPGESEGAMRVLMALEGVEKELSSAIWKHQEAGLRLSISPTFQFVYTDLILDFGNHSEVIETFDFRPYSEELFQDVPRYMVDSEATTVEFQGRQINLLRSVLFLDPDRWTPEEFREFGAFLEKHHKELNKAISSSPILAQNHVQPVKLAGIVHGRYESFEEKFSRRPFDFLTISPFGTVSRVKRDVDSYNSSLVGKVEVRNGRPVLIREFADSLPLKEYMDDDGRAFTQVFDVIEGE